MSDAPETAPRWDARTMVALSERVAVVETQQGALKEDTGVIRKTLHEFGNELLKIRIVEEHCAAALKGMHEIMTNRADQINRIESTVQSLSTSRAVSDGAWGATARIAFAAGGVIGALGVLATILGLILKLAGVIR